MQKFRRMAEHKLGPSKVKRWLAAGVAFVLALLLWLLWIRLLELPPVVDAPEPAKTPLPPAVPQLATAESATEAPLPDEDGVAAEPSIQSGTVEPHEP